MNCPACDSGDTAVRKTIVVGPAVTRLRSCLDCTSEWTTEETVRLIHKRSRVVAGDQGSPSATNDGHPASSKQYSGSDPVLFSLPLAADPTHAREEHDACQDLEPFPVVGKDGRTWRVPQSLVNELAVAFPSVDVVAEGRKARTWCVANPAKRKTAKGMAKFLFNWITRAVNSGNAAILAGARGSPKAQSTGPALCQFHADRHTAGKPSRFPKPDTCSECKHVAALSRPRSPAGAPSSLGDILGGGS